MTVKETQLLFSFGKHPGFASRRVSLQKLKDDIYVLPGGEQVFIANAVRKLLLNRELAGRCHLGDQQFKQIMDCIDESGSDKALVPVHRIGAGPTDKSARFSAKLIQGINDGQHGPEVEKKEATLTFTLPVSQIETVGDGQLAAPLWLILEKIKDKANSKWGAKYRAENSVVSEFVPATLRAATSSRVLALKAWLATIRDELMEEADQAAAKK